MLLKDLGESGHNCLHCKSEVRAVTAVLVSGISCIVAAETSLPDSYLLCLIVVSRHRPILMLLSFLRLLSLQTLLGLRKCTIPVCNNHACIHASMSNFIFEFFCRPLLKVFVSVAFSS